MHRQKHQPPERLELLGWDFLPAERKNFCQLCLHFIGASWVVDKVRIIHSELSLEQGPDMLDRIQVRGVGRMGLELNSVTFKER